MKGAIKKEQKIAKLKTHIVIKQQNQWAIWYGNTRCNNDICGESQTDIKTSKRVKVRNRQGKNAHSDQNRTECAFFLSKKPRVIKKRKFFSVLVNYRSHLF